MKNLPKILITPGEPSGIGYDILLSIAEKKFPAQIIAITNLELLKERAALLKKKINSKTKAIIATHIYGYPLEIDKIKSICKKNKIYLIEDAAEMLGNKFKNKYCGSFGDISTFSFYANKHITTGEGGMILTSDKTLYLKCKSLRNLSFSNSYFDRYNHDDIGWNYRMTNLQAALGCGQLENIKKIIKRNDNFLNVVAAGRFVEKKGFEDLIEVANIIKKENINIKIKL